jgi:predicted ATP-binding protein involved in virulence
MNIREKLIIKDFFSIKEFEWDIKGFNVLTGGMGSGKSIALKLLYFCEQIFHLTIFYEPKFDKKLFSKDMFWKRVEEKFNDFFPSKNQAVDFINTQISYSFLYSDFLPEQSLFDQEGNNLFNLSAKWDENSKRFLWSSDYISHRLDKWQSLFDVQKTPDLLDKIRNNIYTSILSDFSNCFPLASMFIPASRAIAAITDRISSRDQFINKFLELKDFALSFDNISNDSINKILHMMEIALDEKKEPIFKLTDGRKITSIELSSGQQELLYLLLLINDLQDTAFFFGESVSVFIEEPSAHLFPKEQKETIEFLAYYFNLLQSKKEYNPGHRFFISTHSPYVLNTVNNVLEKGRLLKLAERIKDIDTKNKTEDKIKELPFPDLSLTDVSAYMIEESGSVKSMINNEDDDAYIFSEVIEEITQKITDETDKLYSLNSEIKSLVR